jgi:membrane associated rhomboid family serine protease
MPWITLSLAAMACGLAALGAQAADLAYQPADPSVATLLGCHLYHFSSEHLIWDVLTFVALGALSESWVRRHYFRFLALGALLVPPLACGLTPWVTHYAGLSGLVIGQVALLIAAELRRQLAAGDRRRAAWMAIMIALLLAKQLYECATGTTSLVTLQYEGFATVPAAHLLSVLIGLLAGCLPMSGRMQDGAPCAEVMKPDLTRAAAQRGPAVARRAR